MATTSQREAIKTVDQSWTAEQLEIAGKGYVLDSNTPVYYGRTTENVENWISIVSNGIKAAGVPEDKKLAVITPYVKERALSTLLNYQKNSTIKTFEGYLIKKLNLGGLFRQSGIPLKSYSIKFLHII
ncbi:hypothetical protein BpHYR1_035366 [Brachionus plicatilis]|uniref:Uncharacterized protein n=1 Tax=Brachionus plicatilis TaxID=10195 RepID=A0A3M7S8Q3_BRAPC|nr:hypothetical protein BpHYR1_035366 [Brachionus plicatilis]